MEEKTYSKNKRAERLVGKRMTDGIIIDFPAELGYHCPVCEYKQVGSNGNYDGRLDWSEYNGFIYCHECNKDYPSCICMTDKEMATKVYLDCLEELLKQELDRAREEGGESIIAQLSLSENMEKVERFFREAPIDYDDKCNLWFDFLSKLTTK